MTREEQNQAQALDLEERQRRSEEAFERCYEFRGFEEDWETLAREMGITRFYQQLKGETWHS